MLHLDRAEIAARLSRHTLIDRLERAFAADCATPVRQRYDLGGTTAGKTLLLMPGWRANGAIGVKLVTVFADNAIRSLPAVHACYVLFDGNTGAPLAMLDGNELTLRRTGAASALAAKYLARPDASRLLMVGTGELAPPDAHGFDRAHLRVAQYDVGRQLAGADHEEPCRIRPRQVLCRERRCSAGAA